MGDPDPVTGKRPPIYVYEPDAPWSATRDKAQAYGFASFEVDPGTKAGGTTSISVTYYEVTGPYGQLDVFERFTLQRDAAATAEARPAGSAHTVSSTTAAAASPRPTR